MKTRKKKGILLLGLGIAAIVYIGAGLYFTQHFFPRTILNGRKVGGYSAAKLESEITDEIHSYVLKIKTRDGEMQEIAGSDIDLEPQWNDEAKELIETQPAFAWPVQIFLKKELNNDTLVDYDAGKLEEAVEGLECMDTDSQIAPVSATVSAYQDGYSIVPCVMGTTIDEQKIKDAIAQAVEGLVEELSLDKAEVYVDPEVKDDDERLAEAVEKMNRYAKSSITFTIGSDTEVLDVSTFGDWFKLSKKINPVIKKSKVREYVRSLAKKYNTCYSAKKLKTSYGDTVTIPVSHYGWKIDNEKEEKQIIKEIKAAEPVTRELNYLKTANSHDGNDYGNSYVEINLTEQHLFLYKEGKLILETDFVSGNVSKDNGTPTGAFGITYKEKDATLRGEDYETPVKYWMPFAGNVGMHDASWRKAFGGTIYKYGGSHGCINLPPAAAKTIFENVEKNYPVLVYESPGTEKSRNVVKLIDAIGKVTKDSADAVKKARKAYDKLTKEEKSYVENYDKLVQAEKELAKLIG